MLSFEKAVRRLLSPLSSLAMALLASFASAHPGHEHDVPTGVWPQHGATDDSGGVSNAALSVPEVAALTSAATTDSNVAITSWKLATGATGTSSSAAVDSVINTVVSDVNTVAYDADYAYLRTSGIPSHAIGPFNNPSVPGDLDATYRVALNPVEQTGTKMASLNQLGPIGIMVNGAAIYSPSDGTYWCRASNTLTNAGDPPPPNDDWSTNALWRRADGMDDAGGHPSPVRNQTNPDGSAKGLYHYHRLPTGLVDQIDPGNNGTSGSPVVGFAFDGYPIVGPYAYEEQPDGSLQAVQMTSSYTVGDATIRGNLGPLVADYELGSFMEDFVYVAGSGTLNEFNMAYVKYDTAGRAVLTDTSDADGDWAYFLTIDAIPSTGNDIDLDGPVAWPYIVGPEFFGVVDDDLIGGGQTQIMVPDDVTFVFEQLTGDYNADGVVDTADYTAWRDAFGMPTGTLPNDPSGQAIGTSQYDTWRAHFGETVGSAGGMTALAIPEPITASLLAVAVGLTLASNRNYRSGACPAAIFLPYWRRK